MKLLWKLAIPQVCIVLALGLASYFVIGSSFDAMRERYVHDIVENRFKRLEADIAAGGRQAVDTSAIFSRLPEVAAAYALAHGGDINDEKSPEVQKAREKLRKDLAPMLAGYETYAGEKMQLHFHLPNGRSLVRLWRDKQAMRDGTWVDISDDLASFRPTVMEANTSGRAVQGIELGSGGIALRGVVPVSGQDGKQLGSVEVLQHFSPILQAAGADGQIEMTLYINADQLGIATELQDRAKHPRVGGFVRATRPKDGSFEPFVTPELLQAGRQASTFSTYGSLALATLPLKDYRNAQIGVLVCAMKTDAITAMADRAEIILVGMLAGMALAPFLALLFGLRIWVERPLVAIRAKMRDIARGWGDLAEEPAGGRTDEIGELERLFKIFTAKLNSMLKETSGYISMLNNVSDPIFMVNEEFRIVRANKAMAALLCVSEEDRTRAGFVYPTPEYAVEMAKRGALDEPGTIELSLGGKTLFIKPSSSRLADASGKNAGYVVVAGTVTDLVNSERAINEQLARITSVHQATHEAAEELARAAKDLGSQFGDVLRAISSQHDRLDATVSAMEDMNNSVRDVAKRAADTADQAQGAQEMAAQGADVVVESLRAITLVNEQTAKLKESMHGLGSQAHDIGAVLGVITDIADQTNLLALNAAIEAARAGDAGRGFAVVADEVRKLAEKTVEATSRVKTAISSIQEVAKNAVLVVDETGQLVYRANELATRSGEALGSIVSLTAASSEQVQGIARAADEQSATSERINRIIDEVTAMGRSVADRMEVSAKSVDELTMVSARLERLS